VLTQYLAVTVAVKTQIIVDDCKRVNYLVLFIICLCDWSNVDVKLGGRWSDAVDCICSRSEK